MLLSNDIGSEIPSLPPVVVRVNEALSNRKSSLVDVGAIIGQDPGLASRLLTLANSAFYNFSSRGIDSISRAITLIGTRQLCDLVLATTLTSTFKNIPESLISMESFWDHSVRCGLIARILGAHREEPNKEKYFLAGMLHDLGRLRMCIDYPDRMRSALKSCRNREALLIQVEAEEFGYDHMAAGADLMQRWGLPENLVEVAAYHHRPQEAQRYPVDVAIVHVSDVIAHAMESPGSEAFVPPLDSQAWDRLGLSTSVLLPTMAQADRQHADARKMILGVKGETEQRAPEKTSFLVGSGSRRER